MAVNLAYYPGFGAFALLDDIRHPSGRNADRELVASEAVTDAKRKRRLWLLAVLIVLMLAPVPDFNDGAMSDPGLRTLMEALADPLALLAKRSPGERFGPLVSTKGKAGPHERVLSSVRDRSPPEVADVSPVVLDIPVVIDIPPGALASEAPPPAGRSWHQVFGTFQVPGASVGGLGFPAGAPVVFASGPPRETGGQTPPLIVAGSPESPGTPAGGTLILATGETSPPGGGIPSTPPGGTPLPITPGSPSGPPTGAGGGIILVPEPSTWSVMIAGLIGIGFAARRRKTRRRED